MDLVTLHRHNRLHQMIYSHSKVLPLSQHLCNNSLFLLSNLLSNRLNNLKVLFHSHRRKIKQIIWAVLNFRMWWTCTSHTLTRIQQMTSMQLWMLWEPLARIPTSKLRCSKCIRCSRCNRCSNNSSLASNLLYSSSPNNNSSSTLSEPNKMDLGSKAGLHLNLKVMDSSQHSPSLWTSSQIYSTAWMWTNSLNKLTTSGLSSHQALIKRRGHTLTG